MAENKRIRIFIADDFTAIQQVIYRLIEKTNNIEVVGKAPNLKDALREVQALQSDMILMDDHLPPTNSALVTNMFRELGISTAILIISTRIEPALIRQSFENGANGFMYKGEMGTLLIEAIRKVHNNEQYLSPKGEYALAHEND
jgi:DNA-binding NarL/FixJ family response regulator